MATEHTAVGGASEVKLLVHISGWPLVGSWSDLHVGTLPGRKSADVASISAFPVAREREVYQKSASHSVGGFLTDLSCRVCAIGYETATKAIAGSDFGSLGCNAVTGVTVQRSIVRTDRIGTEY